MSYDIQTTDNAYVITIPKTVDLPQDIAALFRYLRYDAIGRMSQITEEDVTEMAMESRGIGIQKNQHWLKDIPGFEELK